MKALLSLTKSLFESAGQPGIAAAESDLALGELLSLADSDPSFAETLSALELDAQDVSQLSISAWVAYLTWRRGVGAPRPSSDFLSAIYDLSADAVTRLRMLEQIVLAAPDGADPWLGGRIDSLVSETDDTRELGIEARENDAFQLAVLLLQVATPGAITALRDLLARDWRGTESLRRNVTAVLDTSLATEDDRREWYLRVGLG